MRLIAVLLLLTLPLISPAAEEASAADRFKTLYEKEWEFRLEEFPRLATSVGKHDYDDRLGHVSEPHQKRRHAFWTEILEELEGIDPAELDAEGRANYAIFERQLRNSISGYETGAYLIPLNSDWGFHTGMARLPSSAPLATLADYRNYLARLKQIPRLMDEYIGLMRSGLERGMTQPRVVLAGREAGIEIHVVDDPEASVFYAPFLQFPATLPESEHEALRKQARDVVEKQVVPAYARFLKFFVEDYRPGSRDTLGASELPNGKAYYRSEVRYYTTLELGPEQIHQIGLDEVQRIRSEMDRVIESTGFEGDFKDFLAFLRSDPQFYAETPRELLMEASYFAKKADHKLPSLFGRLPRQPYGVVPVPDDLAPYFTAGRYSGAPIDSPRAGEYWVNTHDLASRPLYALPALTLHEAVPGHHLQNALAQELGEQPPFRRNSYISAYGEGWGLYSEFLGIEADIYETPYQHFGRLTYEMWRACRLVIDTGVHAFGWSRQQALDYLAGNTALSLHEVTTEVDRYISWPAQALSYKLGELKIRELRQRAEQRLGEAFDLRAFHDTILSQGSVPLTLLEQAVEAWISEREAEQAGD